MSVTLAMDVTYLLLLSSLGLAVNTQAQDCPVPVGGNNMGFKDILPAIFPNGTKVSFECNVGYQSAGGSSSITCTNGIWSPVKLKCEKKSCGNAGEVPNGDIDYHGISFGDKLVVTCNPGYHIVGKGEIYCGDKGWLGRLPTCEAVACSTPESLTNGRFSPVKESYIFPEVVQYECQKDFTMSGSRLSSCSADGTFKPAPPTCIMVKCEEFNLPNSEVLGGSRPPYKHQSTVILGCHFGYNLEGNPTQTCELNSQWAPGLPTCKPVQCDDPDIKHATMEGGSMPPYTFKSTVTFSCTSGYNMKGVGTQTCGPNGQWTPGLPTCEPVQCDDPIIKHATMEGGSMPPYTFKSTVTFSCTSGYNMNGVGTQTCGPNGQWTPGLPTCELMPTTKPPSTTKKTIDDPELVDPPGNNGKGMAVGLGLGLTALTVIVLTALGFYFFGVPAFIKDKKRKRPVGPALLAVKMAS
ncbi:membrane cofactor protein-like isoform X3 [Pungitius pungitius]|uniref:membrane cofactor protein-like isoform X3 n=1 Tax=Pungitius pungitius TaxID=134920 RepID=UPI002E0ECEEA